MTPRASPAPRPPTAETTAAETRTLGPPLAWATTPSSATAPPPAAREQYRLTLVRPTKAIASPIPPPRMNPPTRPADDAGASLPVIPFYLSPRVGGQPSSFRLLRWLLPFISSRGKTTIGVLTGRSLSPDGRQPRATDGKKPPCEVTGGR